MEFPDLPGCLTCGDTIEDALAMAKEALSLHLYCMEEDNDPIPDPSTIASLHLEKNQIVAAIEANMIPFRDMSNRAVKKTLTIPKWLDDMAKEHSVNYSHVLQEALKSRLGVTDHGRGHKDRP